MQKEGRIDLHLHLSSYRNVNERNVMHFKEVSNGFTLVGPTCLIKVFNSTWQTFNYDGLRILSFVGKLIQSLYPPRT